MTSIITRTPKAAADMRRAALYCRISDDKVGNEAGVKRQREDGEKLCHQQDWVIVGTYTDNDLSATKGGPRPEYAAMLAAAERGDIDVIVCWHLSRLWRNRRERAEGIERLCAARVSIRCVKGSELDLSSAMGRGMAAMFGEFDTIEAEVKSERQQRASQQAAEQGKTTRGGHRPFGYGPDRVTVIEPEADIIRECAGRVLAGESLTSVCRDLNTREVCTTTGGQWGQKSLAALLGSARISGRREHRPVGSFTGARPLCGTIVADAEWPEIITPDDSDRLRALLTHPGRRTSPGPERRYLLSGIATCARCGHTMSARPRSDHDPSYRYICRVHPGVRCGQIRIHGPGTDTWVTDHVLDFIANQPDAIDELLHGGTAPDDLHARIIADEDQLDELGMQWGNKEISTRVWKLTREPIEARLAAARRQLAAYTPADVAVLDGFRGTYNKMVDRWNAANLSQRRAVITAVLASVTVNPSPQGKVLNRFDAGRLELCWRQP